MNNLVSFTKGIFNNQRNLSEEKNRNELLKHRVLSRAWLLALAKSIYYVLSGCFFFWQKIFANIDISLRKHPFLLALGRWGRFARRNITFLCAKRP